MFITSKMKNRIKTPNYWYFKQVKSAADCEVLSLKKAGFLLLRP